MLNKILQDEQKLSLHREPPAKSFQYRHTKFDTARYAEVGSEALVHMTNSHVLNGWSRNKDIEAPAKGSAGGRLHW